MAFAGASCQRPEPLAILRGSAGETFMAENKSPHPKRTEIVLAWLGMAGAVGLLWWLVAE